MGTGTGTGTGGIPTTDNIPETTEKLGWPTDNVPETTKKLGWQLTIYPTTDFLKRLILLYSFEIKQINERTNIYFKFYFKIMFLSHNNVISQNQKYLKSCIYIL